MFDNSEIFLDAHSLDIRNHDTETDTKHESRGITDIESRDQDVWTCIRCHCNFNSHSEQVAHFVCDWHVFNVKSAVYGRRRALTQPAYLNIKQLVTSSEQGPPADTPAPTKDGGGEASREGGPPEDEGELTVDKTTAATDFDTDSDYGADTDSDAYSDNGDGVDNRHEECKANKTNSNNLTCRILTKLAELYPVSDSDSTSDSDQHHQQQHRRHHSSTPPGFKTTSTPSQLCFERADTRERYSVYRATVENVKFPVKTSLELDTLISNLGQSQWAIILSSGGHFAASVFKGNQVLVHKTFHRYTVRAKQGTSQSANDKSGNFAKSAGASLRRHNELQLSKDINALLTSWSDQLSCCGVVFFSGQRSRAALDDLVRGLSPKKSTASPPPQPPQPSSSSSSSSIALTKRDSRIRRIPFQTYRPTAKEVTRVHGILATVRTVDTSNQTSNPELESSCDINDQIITEVELSEVFYGLTTATHTQSPQQDSTLNKLESPDSIKNSKKKKKYADKRLKNMIDRQAEIDEMNQSAKSTGPKYKQCIVDAVQSLHSVAMQTADDDGTFPEKTLQRYIIDSALRQLSEEDAKTSLNLRYARRDDLEADVVPGGIDTWTLLHHACKLGNVDFAECLIELGVNPGIRDSDNNTCFDVALNKSARTRLRLFRFNNADKYDFSQSRIPDNYSPEVEDSRRIKGAIKKKAQKERQRLQRKQEKAKAAEFATNALITQEFLKLSDAGKREYLADRSKLCYECGKQLEINEVYSYMYYEFCATSCLRAHRFK